LRERGRGGERETRETKENFLTPHFTLLTSSTSELLNS
jgi:hypothetical protein